MEPMDGKGEEGQVNTSIPQSCPALDLALFESLTWSPVILCPASGLHVHPAALVPKGPCPIPLTVGLSSPLASPTDARLPVGMEHKLDMAAAPGTLLCVIACVLAATVTIVARHCAKRAGGLSACFFLGTTVLHNRVTGPFIWLPLPCSLFLPPLVVEAPYPSLCLPVSS